MKIGIDAREIEQGVSTGIGGPLNDFLRYFARQSMEDECVLFSSRRVPVEFGPKVRNVVLDPAPTFVWDQQRLPEAIRTHEVNVFYSPYYKIPLRAACPTVSAILDLMYLVLPYYRKRLGPWRWAYYMTMGRWFAHKADAIVTCSEHSKRDITRFYGVAPRKIHVIPLSVDEAYRPCRIQEARAAVRKRFDLKGPYLLYVGNFKYHKNVRRLLRVFKRVAMEFRDLSLVLAGPLRDGYEALRTYRNELSLREKVVFVGPVNRQEARFLYVAAEVFVMPSLYEGFGLPPVEAMACGTPVITSEVTSLPEVVGDAAVLVDPYNVDEMIEAVRRLLSDGEQRRALREKGLARARRFGWEQACGPLYALLREVAGK